MEELPAIWHLHLAYDTMHVHLYMHIQLSLQWKVCYMFLCYWVVLPILASALRRRCYLAWLHTNMWTEMSYWDLNYQFFMILAVWAFMSFVLQLCKLIDAIYLMLDHNCTMSHLHVTATEVLKFLPSSVDNISSNHMYFNFIFSNCNLWLWPKQPWCILAWNDLHY